MGFTELSGILIGGQRSKGGLQPSGDAAEGALGRAAHLCGDAREGGGLCGSSSEDQESWRRTKAEDDSLLSQGAEIN